MSYYVYIPIASGNHLLAFAMDPTSGQLDLKHEVDMGKSGHAMCADPTGQYLFVGLHQDNNHILASYSIDQTTGGLTLTGEVALDGMPCHMSTDRSGKYLMAAYYSAGLATVHTIGPNGTLEDPPACYYPTEQFAHFIATDASNRYAFVPHVAAANTIYQFNFDASSGQLTPNAAIPQLAAGAGEGPRHLAFHPNLDLIYADNEQGSSVTVYRLDTTQGTLTPIQTVSTLPAAGHEGNSNAQIQIHPSGKSIYVSNRGHDSIAMFAVDPSTGLITSLGQQPGEKTPRAFGLDPQGQFLFSGADGSNLLRSFRVLANGALEPHGNPIDLGGTCGWVCPLQLN